MNLWAKTIRLIDDDLEQRIGVPDTMVLGIVPLLVIGIPGAFLPLPWRLIPLGIGAVLSLAFVGVRSWRLLVCIHERRGPFRKKTGLGIQAICARKRFWRADFVSLFLRGYL